VSVKELGGGEPLVLLHGLATTQRIWSLVTAELARDRRVITLDLPGFGESEPVGPGFDLGAVGERVARSLAAHGVPAPFDLVGHSLGGGVALTLAARRPRLVKRLVLVAPAGLEPVAELRARLLAAGAEGMFSLRRRLAPLTDLAWGRRLLLAFAAQDGSRLTPAQARMMVEASADAQRIEPALAAIGRADLRPLLTATSAPLGLIWGEHDRAVPLRLAREIRLLRPDVRLEVIAGTGHVPMVERPAEFASALLRLLGRLDKHATTSAPRVRSVP
jgi:pimeloyl-ACP methyl ester carboxylesterase